MEAPPSAPMKWSVFLGIYLLGIFCNVPWVWGNLSVYCSSYFYNRVDPVNGQIAPWLVSLNTIGLTLGVLVCGKLRQAFGLRASLIIGIILFNSGVFSTYFAVRYSSILLDFTLGLIPGIGMGIVQGNQYTLVVRWTNRYQALAASSVESTCVLGSVLINPIVTFYVNPNNLVPNEKIGRQNLFSQPEVLDRVESTFLVYGSLSLAVNCIGFLMTRDFPGDQCYLISLWHKVKCYKSKSNNTATENSPLKSVESRGDEKYSDETITDTGIVKKDEIKHIETNLENDKKEKIKDVSAFIECGNLDKTDEIRDLGPMEVLKTRVFYTLWLTMGVGDFAFISLTTYFKAFGLLYIHDDHFLTSLGTVMCVAIAFISYCGGFAVDKWGVKNAVVTFVSLLCVFSCFYYITPSVNKWLYMVCCAGFGAFDFGLICILSCVALKLWGQTYLSTNYGLLLSSCIITNTVLPPVIETVILTYGWFALFTSVSASIFGALILCVWQIPTS